MALFLGLMVPGLGHLYFKRTHHGFLYMILIAGLFGGGLLLSGGTAVNFDMHPVYAICQFMAAPPAVLGLEYLRAPNAADLGESLPILSHQTGVVYAAVAGVLNVIVLCELYRRHADPGAPGPADTLRRDAVEGEE